jgi:hypothetical protein
MGLMTLILEIVSRNISKNTGNLFLTGMKKAESHPDVM